MSKKRKIRLEDVTPILQRTSSTCWYASYQMLYAWAGKSRSSIKTKIEDRQTIAQKERDPPVADFDYMCRNGIGRGDLVPVARALGLEWGGGDKTTFNVQALLWCLDSAGPIWLTGKWHGAPHAIVLTGASAGKAPVVWYINPWSLHGGGEEIETSLNWINKGRGPWNDWHASHAFNKPAKWKPFSDYASE